MYSSYYGLNQKPFDISPDPDFLWLGEKHREGLATLEFGIVQNKGFLMITGDIGTGKTALIRAMQKAVENSIIVVNIPDPSLSLMEFYNVMAAELGMERTFMSKGAFLIEFKRFILNAAASQRRILMIIDEAHRLSNELLEEIRLLSNIDLVGHVLINTFFVGQQEFKALISRNENEAVRQRITVSYELQPLTSEETRQYIEHRLHVAGASRPVFTTEAVALVHRHSRGYPRLINIICDYALMSGFSSGLGSIGPETIKECSEELSTTIGLSAHEEKKMGLAAPRMMDPAVQHLAEAAANVRGNVWRRAEMVAVFVALAGLIWYFGGERFLSELSRWRTTNQPMETNVMGLSYELPATPSSTGLLPDPEKPSAAASDPLATTRAASSGEAFELKEFTFYFTSNSTDVPISAKDILWTVANLLKDFPETRAVIEGHSDSAGTPSLNREISEDRAISARNFLVRQGVGKDRFTTVGYGSGKPLESNSTADGRKMNRRVVLRIVSDRQS